MFSLKAGPFVGDLFKVFKRNTNYLIFSFNKRHRPVWVAAVHFSMSGKEKKPFRRLPKSVVPIHYNLTLEPDLEKFTFKGNEIIDLEIKKATSKVIMNCVDIELSHVQFTGAEESFKASGIKYDADTECVILEFPYNLPLGMAKLHMEYVGELNDKMKGFYRSNYKTPSGEDRHCAVTQFEATDARRAFPCWDEPAIKATFDITLVVPSDRVALSNMNVISDTVVDESSGRREVRFATTPTMSTYLVAFVVGDFDYVEDFTSSGICVRTYTPVGKANQGKFALEVAVKTLPFYSDYFGIAYPLPKIDLIAIPDFSAGAMENWGLVTYRETALLVDPEMTSAAAKQWVALVVGHELAHQWFGNLVTMEWWTHLWLNEGFASWIEYLCVDHCFPDYDIWTQFVTADYVRALELDALKNSHPIEVPVGHPTEIDEIFDTISYSKGASVIRMLHSYMGDQDFRDGLHSYLTKFKFGNASTDDLWSALEQASKEPVGKIMNTWTKQMGFPVLSISDEQNGTTRILKIRQSKFSANKDSVEEEDNSQWLVPVTIITSKDPNQVCLKTLLSDREMVIFLEDTPSDVWVKLNAGQVCFYRANYSDEMLGTICKGLEDMTLPPRDRLGLENDLFALAQAGEAKAVDYLKLVTSFVNEDNYTVWSDIAGNLSKLGLLFQYLNADEDFSKFVIELFKPVVERVGWEPKDGEGHLTALLRSLAIAKLGCHGHEETVKECQRRFTAHSKGESSISADLRAAVYATAITFGDEQTIADMLALYRSTDHMEEQMRVLRCLGMAKDPELIQKVLEFSMSDEVRFQDTVFALASCGRSIVGRDKLWLFVKENWSEFQSRYQGGFLIARLVKMSTENFATEERYNDVKGFFESNEAPAAERTVQQSLESIRLNINWIAREGEALRAWIRDNC